MNDFEDRKMYFTPAIKNNADHVFGKVVYLKDFGRLHDIPYMKEDKYPKK